MKLRLLKRKLGHSLPFSCISLEEGAGLQGSTFAVAEYETAIVQYIQIYEGGLRCSCLSV